MIRTELNIQGMTCGHCVTTVRNALQSLVGVEVQQVDIGSATVAYDPDVATPVGIAQVVTDAGYPATATTA